MTATTQATGLPVLDATVAEFADRVEICDCHRDPQGECREVVTRALSAEMFDQLAAAGYRAKFHRQHACPWCGPTLNWHCEQRDDHEAWHKTSESTRRRSKDDEITCKACGGPLAEANGCFELVRVSEPISAVA